MDIKLHYREKGQGDPLILLHGNGENGDYFEHQIAHFSKKYRVIAVDTRGHGKSPRGEAPFTIRQFAEDLKCFMDELQIEKANILGFSDGGNIAMIFSMKYPERVDRLILNGANLNGKGVKVRVQLPIIIGYHIALLFARKNQRAKEKAQMLGLMVNDPNLTSEELHKIQAMTLVIAGKKDMIKESETKRIQKNIKNSYLRIIPGDHFVAHRNSEIFNKVVEKFLEQTKNQSV